MQNVAIITGNFSPDRYSYKAFSLLKAHGYNVFPIAPVITELEGIPVYKSISDITEDIDTLTLYLNPTWLKKTFPEIIAKKPGRVIFNPGTEDPELEEMLTQSHIPFMRACTLVLLNTGQFETI